MDMDDIGDAESREDEDEEGAEIEPRAQAEFLSENEEPQATLWTMLSEHDKKALEIFFLDRSALKQEGHGKWTAAFETASRLFKIELPEISDFDLCTNPKMFSHLLLENLELEKPLSLYEKCAHAVFGMVNDSKSSNITVSFLSKPVSFISQLILSLQTVKMIEPFSPIEIQVWLVARGYMAKPQSGWSMNGREFLDRLSRTGENGLNPGVFSEDVKRKIRKFLNIAEKGMGEMIPVDSSSLKTAFQSVYIETDFLPKLQKKINEVAKKYEMFPCFAVFQASGYGKSRILSENAKHHHFTLYWCLRPNPSSGYPPRSTYIANKLEKLVSVS